MLNQKRRASAVVLGAAALAALGLTLGGCASATRSTAIVAPVSATTLVEEGSPLYQAVAIGEVRGGSETTLISNSQVSNAAFREALETSLRLTGMAAPGEGPFIIDASIESVEQPILQINFTTTATVFYRVLTRSGAIVNQERVTTESETSFTESIVRSERIRIATEGAMRENIGVFLANLAASAQADPERYRDAN